MLGVINFLTTFPEFDQYGMTLLILAVQGYLFAFLLFGRHRKEHKLSDLFLALILIVTCYRSTSYIIGFMSWYDAYPTTKINYFLFNTGVVIGPLIYFYIRSITQPYLNFGKKHLWHFVPFLFFILLNTGSYIYDVYQPGFNENQNGVSYTFLFLQPFYWVEVINLISKATYFYLSIVLFIRFRKHVVQFFSDVYDVQLNWLRNFLIIYIGLFIFNQILFSIIDPLIKDLRWTDSWWWFFANALAILYVGIQGYFTNTGKLHELEVLSDEPETSTSSLSDDNELRDLKTALTSKMESEKLYLNPELTLNELAKAVDINANQLSSVINNGFDKNFNDFINGYRVNEVKRALQDPANAHLSILGIALDCGFNSKATFNRVFKNVTGTSPSQFTQQLKS